MPGIDVPNPRLCEPPQSGEALVKLLSTCYLTSAVLIVDIPKLPSVFLMIILLCL